MIRHIHVKNFKSLRDLPLTFGQRNMLVGPNMAGKSNIISLLRFLGWMVLPRPGVGGLQGAKNAFGGFPQVAWRGGENNVMSIEVGGDLPGEEPAARRRFCLSRTRRLGQRQRDYRKAWATACDEAGVPGRFRHDFRRTPVCNMERAGAPRSVAMKITGNKTATAITGTVR